MPTEQQTIDVYWTVQRGRRFTISLSEEAAWASLKRCWAFEEDPSDWTVERTSELVPVVQGRPFLAERECFEQDDAGDLVSVRDEIDAPHVAWECPCCGRRHSTDLCRDLECKLPPDESPQLWFCEMGKGIVLVRW